MHYFKLVHSMGRWYLGSIPSSIGCRLRRLNNELSISEIGNLFVGMEFYLQLYMFDRIRRLAIKLKLIACIDL